MRATTTISLRKTAFFDKADNQQWGAILTAIGHVWLPNISNVKFNGENKSWQLCSITIHAV